MTTLVCCLDRDSTVTTATGLTPPVVGWEAVRSLVTDVGLDDPEATTVNCLLEALRVTRDLNDSGTDAIVAVVSASPAGTTAPDRAVADQIDELAADYDLTATVVVTGTTEDERLLPVIESRLQVDGVDRVVVRQARDIESTYYLLKQFLADEELRTTVLVPLGISLLLVPALLLWFSPAVALAGLAALLGGAVLYKGLGIDEYVGRLPEVSRELLYSGQVSLVTYVTAAGLTIVGVVSGGIAVTPLPESVAPIVIAGFLHSSSPWLTGAAVTAATGRLIDRWIADEPLPTAMLSLPAGLLAVGIIARGFTGYLLTVEVTVGSVGLSPIQRLAVFVAGGILVSLLGVKLATALATQPADPVSE